MSARVCWGLCVREDSQRPRKWVSRVSIPPTTWSTHNPLSLTRTNVPYLCASSSIPLTKKDRSVSTQT